MKAVPSAQWMAAQRAVLTDMTMAAPSAHHLVDWKDTRMAG